MSNSKLNREVKKAKLKVFHLCCHPLQHVERQSWVFNREMTLTFSAAEKGNHMVNKKAAE